MAFHQEKISGGKMLGISHDTVDGKVRIRIYGDFFLHPESRIIDIEKVLEGTGSSEPKEMIAGKVAEALGDARLIGATADDIARIFMVVKE
jgi:hypothetical protein